LQVAADGAALWMLRVGVRELEGRGRGLVATEPIAAGEEVLREPQPVCRAHLAQHLRELQEETALLVSMGYVEFWPHAVKDRRVADACRAAVEAAPAAQRPAFLELEDAFASADGAQAGRFLTNNVQLPGSGECAVYALYSRINHSCEPNVRVDLAADGALSVVALRDVQVGEEVLDNYLAEMMTHGKGADAAVRLEMRRHLAERWRFECACARCEREGPVPARLAANGWEG
jgi:hypothetical protein